MGQLIYGAQAASFDLDDRTLAHVEAVILAKLRRNESFALTVDADHGGRETIWLNQAVQLRFSYASERPKINRATASGKTRTTPIWNSVSRAMLPKLGKKVGSCRYSA